MEVQMSGIESIMRSLVQRYNHNKYWKYRAIVVDPNRGSKIGDLYRLWYIKRSDSFNNASMGTHRNFGAVFAEPPQLPHGLNGIIISHNAVIGYDCKIFHQVTIGEGKGGAPIIGNHVLIGAGSKLIGGIKVGDYVKIAAGCVVMQDIPDNSIVLPGANQIKIKESMKKNES